MSQRDINRIFVEAQKMARNNPNATSQDMCLFLKKSKAIVTRKGKIHGFLAGL